jgi:ABC-type branched-subunit amino acid transport system ATPase component/branched-subunit amino acid ABC-type transport system permease component
MDILRFGLLGLGPGAVYGLLGLGVVLVYRGAGVLNFAHGAVAMVASFVFWDLGSSYGLPTPLALIGAVLFAALIGAAMHFLVMRALRRASALVRLIATLGVLEVLEEAAKIRYGDAPQIVTQYLPDRVVSVGGLTIGADRLVIFGIACVLTVVLWYVYHRTRFGLATSAVVENQRAAAALGWSPNHIALVNWTAGALLAGVAGCLLAPISGVQIDTLSLTIIPTLAAALLGGFESFPLTLAGGVALGVAESEMARYVSTPGIARSVPFVAIALVIVLRGRSLPLRGFLFERLPAIGSGLRRPRVLVAATALVLLLGWLVLPTSWLNASTTMFATAIILLSLVVLVGYTGQLSLAQLALAGLGALITARLVEVAGWPFLPALLVGMVASIPIGLAFALPALRARGTNLAVITMGLGWAIFLVLFNNSFFTGFAGSNVGKQSLFGLDIDSTQYPQRYYTFVFLALVLCGLVTSNLRRSALGRGLITVRSNERAAAALGINVLGIKLYAFAVSSAIAALGGIVLAFRSQSIVYTDVFDVFGSITVVLMAVIGGVGYISGVLFGMTFAPGGIGLLVAGVLGGFDRYLGLISGVVLLLLLMDNPDGLAPKHVALVHAVARRLPRLSRRGGEPRAAPAAALSRPLVTRTAATLEVRNLTVRFGGVTAVRDVSLQVRPGEVVGLIGPNGAGKTTLVDAVTGFVTPATGSVRLGDRGLTGLPAHRRARLGLVRSFQGVELFEDISVRENLQVATERRSMATYLLGLLRPAASAGDMAAHQGLLDELRLAAELDALPTNLPHGRRRLVGIARAVLAHPAILLLDEPGSGLGDDERRQLGELLRQVVRDGRIGVLLIEHDMGFVMSVCDRICVLNFGELIADGTPEEVRSHPAVVSAYLGSLGERASSRGASQRSAQVVAEGGPVA